MTRLGSTNGIVKISPVFLRCEKASGRHHGVTPTGHQCSSEVFLRSRLRELIEIINVLSLKEFVVRFNIYG